MHSVIPACLQPLVAFRVCRQRISFVFSFSIFLFSGLFRHKRNINVSAYPCVLPFFLHKQLKVCAPCRPRVTHFRHSHIQRNSRLFKTLFAKLIIRVQIRLLLQLLFPPRVGPTASLKARCPVLPSLQTTDTTWQYPCPPFASLSGCGGCPRRKPPE